MTHTHYDSYNQGILTLKLRKPHWDDFHLVRSVIRQLRQLRSIFPGKVQSDVTGTTAPQGGPKLECCIGKYILAFLHNFLLNQNPIIHIVDTSPHSDTRARFLRVPVSWSLTSVIPVTWTFPGKIGGSCLISNQTKWKLSQWDSPGEKWFWGSVDSTDVGKGNDGWARRSFIFVLIQQSAMFL